MSSSPVNTNLSTDQLFDKLKETKGDCLDCMFTGENTRNESSVLRHDIRNFYRNVKLYLDPSYAKAQEQGWDFNTRRVPGVRGVTPGKEEDHELDRLDKERSMLIIAKDKIDTLKGRVPHEKISELEDLENRANTSRADIDSISNALIKSTLKAEKLREVIKSRGESLTWYGENHDNVNMDNPGDDM
jgi:hypothetical protein